MTYRVLVFIIAVLFLIQILISIFFSNQLFHQNQAFQENSKVLENLTIKKQELQVKISEYTSTEFIASSSSSTSIPVKKIIDLTKWNH